MAITRYDFSKPSKFAKNHIAGFRNIYEYFCKTSSIILETLLRSEVVVEIENIKESIAYDKINRYSSVRIGFGINEVEPYQASDVMKSGSFRGVPEKLGGYVFGSSIESISSNTASSNIGGRVKTCMVK